MKKIIALAILLLAILVAGCGGTNKATSIEGEAQKNNELSFQQNQPVPHFNSSQLRENLIDIETAEAQGVQTTSFFFNLGDKEPIQTCPSIGSPIASTTQLTNPQHIEDPHSHGNTAVGNMDPTGVYTPPDSSGTYVICVGANGKSYANYWEGFVQTVFGPAKWNKSTQEVELVGPPSFKFSK